MFQFSSKLNGTFNLHLSFCYMKEKLFCSRDVIVWQGVITTFEVVKELIDEDDEIRLADDDERRRYLEQGK